MSWLFDVELAWTRFRRKPVRTLVGTWAVIVAVAAVTFVLGLGDGLHQYLSRRLQAFTPALWIEAPATAAASFPSAAFAREILARPSVTAVSGHVALPVLVAAGRRSLPARMEGLDPDAIITVLPGSSHMIEGRAPAAPGEAALGAQLAVELGVGIGDRVLVTPVQGEHLELIVTGLIEAGFTGVDAQLVLTALETAAHASGPGARWGYAVAVEPNADLASLRLEIQQATGAWVQPWYEGRSSLLEALAVERQVMLWISLAAVATAAFATASVTALRVMEQRYELAILFAVGARSANALRTVLAESLTSAVAGAATGAGLGWAAGWALSLRPVPLPPQFGVTYLPVSPRPVHALLAIGLAVAATALASAGPALRAARLDPAALLRDE